MVTKTIEIRITEKSITQKINVMQSDSGRSIRCVVCDATIPSASTAKIYAKKPSGKKVYNNCEVSGNDITIDLTTQMLAEIGEVECQIEISQSGERVTSFSFYIVVNPSLSSETAPESFDESSALEQLVTDAENVIDRASTAARTAESAAENAGQAAGDANSAALSANNAASAANGGALLANEAAGRAENAAETAETNAARAEAAAEAAEAIALGDISEKTVTFSEAEEDTDITSGDKQSTLFGKILKRFNTLKETINVLNTNMNKKISKVGDYSSNSSSSFALPEINYSAYFIVVVGDSGRNALYLVTSRLSNEIIGCSKIYGTSPETVTIDSSGNVTVTGLANWHRILLIKLY